MLLVRQLVDPSSGSREVEAAAQAEFAQYAPTAYAPAAHYPQLGDMPKALAWLARAPVRKTDGQSSLLPWPSVAPLRRHPLFFSQMARLAPTSRASRPERTCQHP